MPSQSTNVFVSYSHADASLVAPIVKLLRVNKSLVFQDIDGIQPGKRWRSEIAKALAESHLVVVFWCDHARRSSEVSKEWKAAIKQEKDLLPLLLDATPLPPELDEFQWIDFRETVGASHSAIYLSTTDDVEIRGTVYASQGLSDSLATGVKESAAPRPKAASVKSLPVESLLVKSARWLFLAGLMAAFVTVVALSLFTLDVPQAPLPNHTLQPPGPTLPPPPSAEAYDAEAFDFVLSILFPPGVFFAVMACLVWFLKRARSIERARQHSEEIKRRRQHPEEIKRRIASKLEARRLSVSSCVSQGEIERRIASELEAEILRRIALRRDGEA